MRTWEYWYELAKEYYLEHSDLLVPASYITSSGEKLGQWIGTQRSYYKGRTKRGSISADQIHALEQIGMVWDPLSAQWESAYEDAKNFYLANGHLMVPKGYRGFNGINLNAWLANQRGKYYQWADGYLSAEQIERLEKIGMRWDCYQSKWDEMYALARMYFEEKGSVLIPERYVTPSGVKLGTWLERQRKKRVLGSLSAEQIEKLDKLGMCWDPFQEQFEKAFAEALLYFEKVGDLEIPATFETDSGFKLGYWISNLRSSYKQGKLTADVIERLENIGMLWSATDNPIQTSYAEQVLFFYLKKYFPDAINRYTDIGVELDIFLPQLKVGVEYDGVYWHKDKKTNDNKKNVICYEHGIRLYRLREKGCPKLNGKSVDVHLAGHGIGYLLSACQHLLTRIYAEHNLSPIPKINYYDDIAEIRERYRHAVSDTWNEQFDEAREYYLKNGNLRVPYNYVTETGFHLGTWITNARSAYAGYSDVGISRERIDQLNAIGMIWSVPEEQWEQGFQEAEEYYRTNGNLRVAINYVSNNGYKLGVWIRSQRKQEKLTPAQVERLAQIGMIWDVFGEDWETGYAHANAFYNLNGHLRVPAKYVHNGFQLGNWIATQRSRNKEQGAKPLTPEQTDLLNAIGMIWNVQDALWEEGYSHALQYFKTHGDLLVPHKYRCKDDYPLGTWIAARRGGYIGFGSWARPTDAQIARLEEIGMVWDVEDHIWKLNYLIAKEYYRVHGNLRVPKRYVTPDGKNLGIWIQNQRRMYRGKSSNKNLTEERISLLDQLEMIW